MRRGRTRQADPPAAEGPLLHLEIGPLPLSAELQGKNSHSCVRSPLQGPRDVGGLDVPLSTEVFFHPIFTGDFPLSASFSIPVDFVAPLADRAGEGTAYITP